MRTLSLSQTPERPANAKPGDELPLVGHRVSAGFPSPATDYLEDTLDLNDYLVRNKPATFLFRVKGESMLGASINDGDKVVVDRSLTAMHKDIVVAVVDGEFTLKRLHLVAGRHVELRAEHPSYPSITFKEGSELTIWGVVIGLVRRYRRS